MSRMYLVASLAAGLMAQQAECFKFQLRTERQPRVWNQRANTRKTWKHRKHKGRAK